MYKKLALIALASTLFAGCATTPMESIEKTTLAQEFNSPSEGNSGLYIYRSGTFAGGLKKKVWVNGKCIGQTAPNVFFYEEVEGDREYNISTQSEFSPNDLLIKVKSGMLYFIRQYMKIGVFSAGADIELVDELEGKKAVKNLKMAKEGMCIE